MQGLYVTQEIIDYYMGIKGIKKYTDLLKKIGEELGLKDEALSDFPKYAKSNFSKVLKGERTLNIDYVVPLEKILGVSLARMLDKEAYKLPMNKEDVPFIKGFRYYAYKDDTKLYENELSKMYDKQNRPIICNPDEFGKYFLDYIVEYNSVNAIRFIYDTYHIKLKWWHNQFEIKPLGNTYMNFENSAFLARMIANMNDVDLFYNIYDTYNMFILNGHYGGPSGAFEQDDFLKVILDNNELFNSIFEKKQYEYTLNKKDKEKLQKDKIVINTINPIVNGCLRCALKHLDKYKKEAIKILKYGIDNNNFVLAHLNRVNHYYLLNDLGGLIMDGKEIIDLIIMCDNMTEDTEVNKLIEKLPTFKEC